MSGEHSRVGSVSLDVLQDRVRNVVKALEDAVEDTKQRDRDQRATDLERSRWETNISRDVEHAHELLQQLDERVTGNFGRIAKLESRATTAPQPTVDSDRSPLSDEQRELVKARTGEVTARTKIYLTLGVVLAGVAGALVTRLVAILGG